MSESNKRSPLKWSTIGIVLFRLAYSAAILLLVGLLAETDMDTRDFVGCCYVFIVIVATGVCAFGLRWLTAWLYYAKWKVFRWRSVRICLYIFAGGVAAIALFNAEENWRGKRDWETYKRAAEAKGERFDLSAFDPPPVPDDQNFAFAPIVSNSCIVAAVWNGTFFEECSPDGQTNIARPRLEAKISARFDWKQFPTNLVTGNWQFGKKVDLKALQDYYRAPIDLNWWEKNKALGWSLRRHSSGAAVHDETPTNEFPVSPQPQSPARDVLLAMSKFAPALEQLRAASLRPFCRFPTNGTRRDSHQLVTVNLQPLTDCADVLRLRAVAELEVGEGESALADVELLLRLANCPNQRTHSRLNRAMQPIWQGLVDHKWSEPELAAIEAGLVPFDFLADYQFTVRRCRAELIDGIESAEKSRFHEFWSKPIFDSDMDGRYLPQRIFSGEGLYNLIPRGWFVESEILAARVFQQALQTDAEVQGRNLSEAVTLRIYRAREEDSLHPSLRDCVAPHFFSYSGGIPSAHGYALAQTHLDEARLACALERYRLENGAYPGALDELAPRFIEGIPRDVINTQPLHYRRTDNGQFLLYSVGWNGKDDGGVPRPRAPIYASIDDSSCDWVWPKVSVGEEPAAKNGVRRRRPFTR